MSAGQNERPMVSVVIAAYNAERYIEMTLDSVLAQCFEDFEVIVVDDGSTDHTVVMSEAKGEKVKVISIPNAGPAAARNRGVIEAKGDYIAFIDSDDIWTQDKLEKQLVQMSTDASQMSFTDQFIIDEVGRTTSTPTSPQVDVYNPLPDFFQYNFITTSSVVIERQVFLEVGSFNDSPLLRAGGEDGELWFRVLASGARLSHIRERLVGYRVHEGNVSGGFLSHLRARDISNGLIVQQLESSDRLDHYLPIRTLAKHYARQLSFRTAGSVLSALPSYTFGDRLTILGYRLMSTRAGETLLRLLHWLKYRFST